MEYILAKYLPKTRDAIENKWEPFLQTLTPPLEARVTAVWHCRQPPLGRTVWLGEL
jgi:hypothetical protein